MIPLHWEWVLPFVATSLHASCTTLTLISRGYREWVKIISLLVVDWVRRRSTPAAFWQLSIDGRVVSVKNKNVQTHPNFVSSSGTCYEKQWSFMSANSRTDLEGIEVRYLHMVGTACVFEISESVCRDVRSVASLSFRNDLSQRSVTRIVKNCRWVFDQKFLAWVS